MAEAITIARPYAEAVFKLARETGAFERWSQTLALLETVVRDKEVARYSSDPNVSAAQVEALLLGICGAQLDGAGRNFVQTLVHNDRLAVLPEIRSLYEQLRLEQEGVLEVEIQSAFALDDAQAGQIVATLEARHNRKVRARVSVDPALVGGVRILVGDRVLDATVRGKLDAMAAALIR
jgi:F-type H+-transporting ATPase subunit delta